MALIGRNDFCDLADLCCDVHIVLDHYEQCTKAQVWSYPVGYQMGAMMVELDGLMLRVSVAALAFAYRTYLRHPRQSTPCCAVAESRQMADNLLLITHCMHFVDKQTE